MKYKIELNYKGDKNKIKIILDKVISKELSPDIYTHHQQQMPDYIKGIFSI